MISKVLYGLNLKDAIFNNNLNKKYKLKFNDIKVYRLNSIPLNFQKNTLFINEYRLYKILLSSNKKETTEFIEKITLEIIVPLGRIRSRREL